MSDLKSSVPKFTELNNLASASVSISNFYIFFIKQIFEKQFLIYSIFFYLKQTLNFHTKF